MNRIVQTAYAKVNLALHIRARRANGYHEIETLFAFLDDGDKVSVEPYPEMAIEVFGPYAQGVPVDDTNLAMRAALAMRAHFGVDQNIRVRIAKMLPMAAGIGGGSADAAAVARGLAELWELDAEEAAIMDAVRSIGADLPACVASRTIIGRGLGDRLEETSFANQIRGKPILLVNPGKPCPTGPVYQAWDGIDRGSLAILPSGWRNDLTASAVALVPEIGRTLYHLAEMEGVGQVAMSGSGATCFALFDTVENRDEAKAELADMEPDWWMMGGILR